MPPKTKRERVNVDHIDLRHDRSETHDKRLDHFWEGTVQVNAQTFAVLFHVWRDPGFSKQTGWWYSLDVNPEKLRVVDVELMCDSCEKCSGARDGDGIHRGAVATALYEAFVEFGEAHGFPPAASYKSGWFTFEMHCDLLSRPKVQFRYRHQCVEYRKRIDCPIHGPHTKLTREWSA